MRHSLCLLLGALLLVGGMAWADTNVVALTLRPESKTLDTLDWRHATAREFKQVTFPTEMPLYATVELGFQEPAPRGLPWRLILSSVEKVTVVVSAGGQSRKAYLLVDEQGRGVAITPGDEDSGKKDEVHVAGADQAQGPVSARFGIPIWAPMPVDDHVEISIGVAVLPSFGRMLFEELLGAATARATGVISGAAGEDTGQALQKSADRALAWFKQTDDRLGKPIVLKRLQVCRDSPLTCGGVLGSQVVVVTEAEGSAEDFATKHEVRDGQLRVSANGNRYPEFVVFARLQVEPLPRTAFTPECVAALEQGPGSGKLAERCPAEGLAASHQPRFVRLRDALARFQSESSREDSALSVYALAGIYGDVCGRDDTQLPLESLPCQRVRTLLEGKPRTELRVLGEALAKYRGELESLAALPGGGQTSCKQERELRERFQRASQAFVGIVPVCRFDADDLLHPLRCGGLPAIESLAARLGQKRGELVDACREQGLCHGDVVTEPALRMSLEAICGGGISQPLASFALDTTPIVTAFEGSSLGNVNVKEPLDVSTTERVLAAVRARSDSAGTLPETEVWRTLVATLRQRLDAVYVEYVAARQLSEELAEGETSASRQVAHELTSFAGPVRAESSDVLERTVQADLDELRRMPHPFARLFKGGREHFVPIQGAARDIRLGRSALYRRLTQDLEALRQRQPVAAPQQGQRLPVAAPAG